MKKISKGIIWDGDKFLLLKRSDKSKSFPGFWDFPGGKHDDGETPAQALIRELKEETNFDIEAGNEIRNITYQNDNWNLLFYYFKPKILQGELKLSDEHSEYKWITEEELNQFNLHPSVPAFFD